MSRSLRRLSARVGRWPRWCAAGSCLLLALVSALGASRGSPAAASSHTVAVVVAARDLPAGHLLVRGDLRVARWPVELRPAHTSVDGRSLVGERLAGPLAAREAVTARRLVGSQLTTGLAPGIAAVPVTLDDEHAADVVHPGDRVDLLGTPRPPDLPAAGPARATVRVTASRVLVLAVLRNADGAGTELVLAADRATSLEISRRRMTEIFTVVVQPP